MNAEDFAVLQKVYFKLNENRYVEAIVVRVSEKDLVLRIGEREVYSVSFNSIVPKDVYETQLQTVKANRIEKIQKEISELEVNKSNLIEMLENLRNDKN